MNSKHKRHEENYTKAYHNQIVKIIEKNKNFKAVWGEKTHPTQRNKDESRFFSSETMQAGRATSVKYGSKKQPRILHPAKLSFKDESEILFQIYKSWEN